MEEDEARLLAEWRYSVITCRDCGHFPTSQGAVFQVLQTTLETGFEQNWNMFGCLSFLPGASSWGLVHLLLDPGGPSVLLEASLVSIAQGLHTGSLSHGEIMTLAERTLTHYSCDENCNHGICAITKDQEVDMVILTMPLICLWL